MLDRVFGDHVGTYLNVGSSQLSLPHLTEFFYRRGWRGVNLAPTPRLYSRLQAVRPGDLNLPLAAWDANGEIPVFEVEGEDATANPDGLSTFSAKVAERHRAEGHAIRERRVPVRTIRSLVEELAIDPPDILAIDAEGAEEPALRGIPFESWRPRIFVVESPSASQHGWEALLREHGYFFATFNGVNRFYLRDDLRDLLPRLVLPVSKLDRFRSAELVALEARVRDLEAQSGRWRIDEAHRHDRGEPVDRRHAELEERLALAEQGRERWQRACEALSHELIATQRSLRPYRLLDRFGVVAIGYRWARRLKPR